MLRVLYFHGKFVQTLRYTVGLSGLRLLTALWGKEILDSGTVITTKQGGKTNRNSRRVIGRSKRKLGQQGS